MSQELTPEEKLAELEAKMAAEAAENEGMPSQTEVATAEAGLNHQDARQAYAEAVDAARAVRIDGAGAMDEVRDRLKEVRAKKQRPTLPRTNPDTARVVEATDLARLRQQIREMNG